MNHKPLPRAFYHKNTIQAAQDLLGHFLLRNVDGEWCGGEIVETEAYVSDDPACHAYVRETPRNRTMWGEPGHAYVYRIYGYHFCINAVCRPAGIAEAVLIRAIEPRFGLEAMQRRRAVADLKELSNGPAKLCQALGVTLESDGADVTADSSAIMIAKNPDREDFCRERGPVVTTTRVGISKAADWPLRWYLDGSSQVSKRVPRRKVCVAATGPS